MRNRFWGTKIVVGLIVFAWGVVSLADERVNKRDLNMASTDATERATLAGGCFWGMEDILRQIPGVVETTVGYTGGNVPHPTYPVVSRGNSGHAEAVEVVFNPAVLTYAALLGWFFRMHDPTTINRQGNDVGTQYRSTIFFHNSTQRETAQKVMEEINRSKKWPHPLVTTLEPAGPFFPAEDYHQDYLVKNPGGYTCHFLRD